MCSSHRMHSFDRDRAMCLTLCDRAMCLMLCGLLLAGCALFEHPQPTPVVVQPPATAQRERVVVREPVIVRDAPPPRMEAITVAPSSQHVWVPGYWTWRDDDWAWQSGHWELRP
ncbi:MAG: YXWGXW repeat-containing protein [Candidatus Competibacteraceae bacterium]|nr:YXWGXW repeat-containing protein [Candidatus Competibacteraceae bacterium]